MDVDDFDGRVILEMLAQLGDVDVHGAGVEVIVVNPDGLEGEVALEYLVDVCAEQAEQFRLLGSELGHLVVDKKYLLLSVEGKLAYLIHCNLLALLALDTAQDGLDAKHEFLH